ncbi:unnamed protein product [Urochloa humidicola]
MTRGGDRAGLRAAEISREGWRPARFNGARSSRINQSGGPPALCRGLAIAGRRRDVALPLVIVLPPLGRKKKSPPPNLAILPPSLRILPRRLDRASPRRDQAPCHRIDLIPKQIEPQAPSKGAHFVIRKPIWLWTKHQQDKPTMELTRLCLSASVLMNIRFCLYELDF